MLTSTRTLFPVLGIWLCVCLFSTPLAAQIGPLTQVITDESGNDWELQYHKIQSGDNLYKLSRQYDLTLEDLMDLNGLNNQSTIYPGQRIVVGKKPANEVLPMRGQGTTPEISRIPKPANDPILPPAEDEATTLEVSKARMHKEYYEVVAGDNLYAIAQKFGVTAEQLREWNGGIRTVKPGQNLVVAKTQINVEQDVVHEFRKSRNEHIAPMTERSANNPGIPEIESTTVNAVPPAYKHLGKHALSCSYGRYDIGDDNYGRFYAVHKTLKIGTKINIPIPGNGGFFQVEIIGSLPPNSEIEMGLSPASIQILTASGLPTSLMIIY
ncbi:LysM domain-containing protein [Pontibacter sp. G13]|uniref:LysM peptidoglycan-binding domain-containing protein n=1 Tax=Pontibacter sp. G13 TaxID=3074898 RepID=UPI00288C0542|nr:LysM domain-containing protein [Pontibacter sp. G13]WNJ19723.1 LysM domain-containing protein [Pontibacter sp. G13]